MQMNLRRRKKFNTRRIKYVHLYNITNSKELLNLNVNANVFQLKEDLGGSSTRQELLDWLLHKDLNEGLHESLVDLTIY